MQLYKWGVGLFLVVVWGMFLFSGSGGKVSRDLHPRISLTFCCFMMLECISNAQEEVGFLLCLLSLHLAKVLSLLRPGVRQRTQYL